MVGSLQLLIIGVICFPLLAIAVYFRKARSKGKEKAEANLSYIHKGDPAGEVAYKKIKNASKQTFADLVEKSWQFLYDITDIVTTKFSDQDREEALSLGKILIESGGNYEHVVEYGIKHNLGRSGQESEQTKNI
ncbi:MAG: DUF2660 domain-containing protein [Pseudomonadota bacterium]